MSLPLALALLSLAMGICLLRPDKGILRNFTCSHWGGLLARLMLPGALIVPNAIGWLGWQGQLYGLYRTNFGVALSTTADILAVIILLWCVAGFISRLDEQRTRVEALQRESEARLGRELDAIPQMIWALSQDGEGEYYNLMSRRHLGLFEDERTSDDRVRSTAHPSDLPNYDLHWASARLNKKSFELECLLLDRAGAWRLHLIRAVPVPYDDGASIRWFATATDIEDIQRANAELKALNETLEARVAERTEQLERSNCELVSASTRAESANHAKAAFLAAMSHEIRTPMNSILGISDMLQETPLDDIQSRYVEILHRAGSNLLTLINDLLDMSKIESGRLELESLEFDPEAVVTDVIEMLSQKALEKGLLVLAKVSPDIPSQIIGDPVRVRQILLNLVGNAVKFTAQGEVLISVTEKDANGTIEFAISDTGIGIPANKIELIFEDFVQAESSVSRQYGGTGLGLTISRRLAQLMGGGLSAESEEGKGSTFRFQAQFKIPAQPTLRALDFIDDLYGKRVLVVDDNATNRMILREMLVSWGMSVDSFDLPTTALEKIAQSTATNPYALAIVDRTMRGTDGFDFAIQLHALRSNIPVIMLSLDSRPGDAARRLKAGITEHAVRPVRRTVLLKLICNALGYNRHALAVPKPALPVSQNLDPSNLPPLSLLIAEDTGSNRDLLEFYLKGEPYTITFAFNGQEAVDQFSNGSFGLILMDVQMPVMDGLTATRTIRSLEAERNLSPIPIIALSAHASAQDVVKSLEAGCHAHVTKPVSKKRLLAALHDFRLRCLGNESAPETGASDTADDELGSGIRALIPGYLRERNEELASVSTLLEELDFDTLRRLGHGMKGSGAPYGFTQISDMGALLEQAALAKDSAEILQQTAVLTMLVERLTAKYSPIAA